MFRSMVRSVSWEAGFAVRRDWPDGGHEFVRFERTAQAAAGFVPGDVAYWRRGPVRPAHSVVPISSVDFELHVGRRLCHSPDCPQPTPVDAHVAPVRGGR